MIELRYVDLFCGLGAFHEAFKKTAGLNCVLACDLNEKVRDIYEANHGLRPLGDIRSIDPSSSPDFEILCAGFPCQSFSIAGLKKGFGDARNGNLFYEVLKFVDAKEPPMVILENVKNLKSHEGGKTYSVIEKSFLDRGYRFSSKVLDSAHYGSPQSRQRIFMVATKDREFKFPEKLGTHKSVSSILDRGDSSSWDDSRYYLVEKKSKAKPFKPRIIYNVHSKDTKNGGRQGERVYDPDGCGVTVCASSGGPGAKTGLYKVGGRIRRLNSGECLQMFGFPKSYNFLDVAEEQKMFYLGNSIVVNVIDALVPEILRTFSA
jgi:DNA (cytosine-5)-methyltransferase 1